MTHSAAQCKSFRTRPVPASRGCAGLAHRRTEPDSGGLGHPVLRVSPKRTRSKTGSAFLQKRGSTR